MIGQKYSMAKLLSQRDYFNSLDLDMSGVLSVQLCQQLQEGVAACTCISGTGGGGWGGHLFIFMCMDNVCVWRIHTSVHVRNVPVFTTRTFKLEHVYM